MKKHKKKREIKKQFNIWIFFFVILIVILFLISCSNKKVQVEEEEIATKKVQVEEEEIATKKVHVGEKKVVVIENLTFNENRDLISFYIRNDYSEHANCSVTLFLNDDSFSWNVGIIKPNSRKLLSKSIFMPEGTTNVKLSADCQWTKEIDVLECKNSTSKICDLVKEDLSLKQCLNRDIPGQYFCIALIKKDASYCDDIEILPRKIHCKAYIEKKPELCATLKPESRDWCYQDYGLNKRNKEVCEKIENIDKKNSCLGVVTLNAELCKDINEGDKFMCILNIAEFTKNKALCELLVDKESCYKDLEWMG